MSRRIGFALLLLTVIASFAFVMLKALWQYDAIQRYNSLGLAGSPDLSPGGSQDLGRRSVFLDIDSQMWNLFAAEIATGASFRVRKTDFDNYPSGREVHWSSGYAWLLVLAGRIWKIFTHTDIRTAIERASIFVNPVLHLLFILVAAVFSARRFHWWAGVISTLAIAGSAPILDTLNPGMPDHHGLITLSAAGMMLGLFFGGSGFTRSSPAMTEVLGNGRDAFLDEKCARRWFIMSGVFAGAGFWISSITMTLLCLAVGGAVAASMLVYSGGGRDTEVRYAPELWLWWGASGAVAGFLFYLLEYFPGAMALRLEVNHPLYHLALLGGSGLLAVFCRCRVAGRPPRAKEWLWIAAAIGALAPLPIFVFVGGEKYFLLSNPMLWRWHKAIVEFYPISRAKYLELFGIMSVVWLLAAAVLPKIAIRKERRSWLAFGLGAALVPFGLTCWQQRWASLLAVTLLLAPFSGILGAVAAPARAASLLRARWHQVLILVLVLAQFIRCGTMQLAYAHDLKTGKSGDMQLALYSVAREAAEYIRIFEHDRRVVILSTPWPTVVMCYSGDFKGVGSLYWENLEGIKAFSDILTATSDSEALRLIRERGIRYMAFMQSDYNVPAYFYRKYGREPERREIEEMFGTRLMSGAGPWWIQRIPFRSSIPKFRSGALFYKVSIFRIDTRIFNTIDGKP